MRKQKPRYLRNLISRTQVRWFRRIAQRTSQSYHIDLIRLRPIARESATLDVHASSNRLRKGNDRSLARYVLNIDAEFCIGDGSGTLDRDSSRILIPLRA